MQFLKKNSFGCIFEENSGGTTVVLLTESPWNYRWSSFDIPVGVHLVEFIFELCLVNLDGIYVLIPGGVSSRNSPGIFVGNPAGTFGWVSITKYYKNPSWIH